MFAPVADQQILAGAAGTLSWQHLDAQGEPADPGIVTVGVTRANGTVVLAAGTATTGTGAAARTAALTATHTSALDLLVATWTRTTDSTTYTTRAEVVGGYYFTLAKARASDPVLADTSKYLDATLQGYRHDIEDEFEAICDVAFVPRFRRQALDGRGGDTLLLPTPLPRRVTAVAEVADDGTSTSWSAGDLAGLGVDDSGQLTSRVRSFPYGSENVVVSWEHGHDRPPPDVVQAALLRLRYRATRPKTAIPDRATSFQAEGGNTYRLDTANRSGTGIPDVDAVLDRLVSGRPRHRLMVRTWVVLIEVTPLEEPTTGLWCPPCALPSGVAAHFALALNGVPQRVLRHGWCTGCGRELEEPDHGR